MTPKDYRPMADQCFQWVHEAKTIDERRAYLKLGRAWLEADLPKTTLRQICHPLRDCRLSKRSAKTRTSGGFSHVHASTTPMGFRTLVRLLLRKSAPMESKSARKN